MKHINILYFVFAVFALAFGITIIAHGEGKLWANIGIILIGLYFLYRGIAITHNNRLRQEDEDNDPANA